MPFQKYKYVPKTFLKNLILALGILSQLVFTSPVVSAQQNNVPQQGNGMQVSPALRTFTLDPGESTSYELRITNITDKPLKAESIISDFEQKEGEEGIPILLLGDKQSAYSLKGYVKDLGTLSIEPKEQKVLNVSITVPKDASPGAHYGALRFLSTNDGSSGETVVNLAAGIGVLIFINVTGNVKDNLSLLQVSAAKNGKTGGIFDSGPLTVVTRVKNNGNTFLKPFGRIIVRDWKNRVMPEKDLNADKSKLVIPGTVRRLEDDLDSKRKYFGRYKVEINMSYGEGGGDIIVGSATFWVLPWKQVIAVLVVLALLVLAIIKMLTNYKRRILKESRNRQKKL